MYAPHLLFLIGKPELAQRYSHFRCPSGAVNTGFQVPNRIPGGIPVIAIIRNIFVTLHARHRTCEGKCRPLIFAAIDVYFHPISFKTISARHPLDDLVRIIVIRPDQHINIPVVVEQFESRGLGRRCAVIRVVLCEITAPFYLVPGRVVCYSIYFGRVQTNFLSIIAPFWSLRKRRANRK